MSTAAVSPLAEIEAAVQLRLVEMEIERRDAMTHPAMLLDRVTCLDAKTGEKFRFHLNDPESGWYWQRGVLDGWLENDRSLELKARQIGVTWLAAGLALWYSLYQPGARTLIISINEVEAIKVVNRIWDMWRSVPEHLRNGRVVVKPSRGIRPTTEIQRSAAKATGVLRFVWAVTMTMPSPACEATNSPTMAPTTAAVAVILSADST